MLELTLTSKSGCLDVNAFARGSFRDTYRRGENVRDSGRLLGLNGKLLECVVNFES